MCQFFSFITEPECHGGQRFYFDWDNRQQFNFDERQDSHSSIAKFYRLNEDKCNKYEYNPLTGAFKVDQINSEVDDSIQAEEWVRKLDFKKIVEPLIIKPIIHPLMLPKVEKVTEEQIDQLKQSDPNKLAEKFGYKDKKRQVGLIAQQLNPSAPEVVKKAPFDVDENGNSKSGENFLAVQYEKLVPIVVQAIKEQQKKIAELMKKIEDKN